MNAGLIILRVASERSSVAAATPSQEQLRRSSTTTQHLNGRLIVASLLAVLLAAPRGGTRRNLEEGRELRAASAPSQQHQLRRSSSSIRRRQCECPATMSGIDGGFSLKWSPRFTRSGTTLPPQAIKQMKELGVTHPARKRIFSFKRACGVSDHRIGKRLHLDLTTVCTHTPTFDLEKKSVSYQNER